jgi:hypothetical protein
MEVQHCVITNPLSFFPNLNPSVSTHRVVGGKTIYNTSLVYDIGQSRLTVASRVKRLLTLGAKPAD